jgi:hemin uptake protein HemP
MDMIRAEAIPARAPQDDLPEIDARDLLNGHRVIRIVHEDRAYTLRLTRQGKLLLTR